MALGGSGQEPSETPHKPPAHRPPPYKPGPVGGTYGQIPQLVVFVANPPTLNAGQSSRLCWQVNNATDIGIIGIGMNLNANDCAVVTPLVTTIYVLTATNGAGDIQATVTITVNGSGGQ